MEFVPSVSLLKIWEVDIVYNAFSSDYVTAYDASYSIRRLSVGFRCPSSEPRLALLRSAPLLPCMGPTGNLLTSAMQWAVVVSSVSLVKTVNVKSISTDAQSE